MGCANALPGETQPPVLKRNLRCWPSAHRCGALCSCMWSVRIVTSCLCYTVIDLGPSSAEATDQAMSVPAMMSITWSAKADLHSRRDAPVTVLEQYDKLVKCAHHKSREHFMNPLSFTLHKVGFRMCAPGEWINDNIITPIANLLQLCI
eukprot:jgi/Ulvmu1/703/UM010_0075.1